MYTLGCFQCAFCHITFAHVAIYLRFCSSNVFGGWQNVHLGRAASLGRPRMARRLARTTGPVRTDAPQSTNPVAMKRLGEQNPEKSAIMPPVRARFLHIRAVRPTLPTSLVASSESFESVFRRCIGFSAYGRKCGPGGAIGAMVKCSLPMAGGIPSMTGGIPSIAGGGMHDDWGGLA